MSTKEKTRPAKAAPPMPSNCDAVLNNEQVAFALSISIRKLQDMISAGEFPSCDFRIGDSPRWRVGTVNAWIAAQSVKPKG